MLVAELRAVTPATKEQYRCVVCIRNISTMDLSSDLFDRGRPIMLSLNTEIKQVAGLRKKDQALAFRYTNERIVFGPELLKGREEWRACTITSGRPRLTIEEDWLKQFRFVKEFSKQRERVALVILFLYLLIFLGIQASYIQGWQIPGQIPILFAILSLPLSFIWTAPLTRMAVRKRYKNYV